MRTFFYGSTLLYVQVPGRVREGLHGGTEEEEVPGGVPGPDGGFHPLRGIQGENQG